MALKSLIPLILIGLLLLTGCQQSKLGERPEELEKDLNYYPFFFFDEEEKFDAVIIIDSLAGEEDAESASLLLDYFKEIDPEITEESIRLYPEYADLSANNAVLVGSCSQQPQNRFVNIYTDCLSMKKEQALIRVVNHNGAWLLYVVGYDVDKTRNAVKVLMDYEKYDLEGQDVEVVKVEEGFRIREPT